MYTKFKQSNNLSIMENLEYKELLLEKVEEGIVYGYASVKNIIDGSKKAGIVGDVCVDGCYINLEDTVRDGFVCNSHDHSEPLGFFLKAVEDEKGLWVEFKFHSTEDAQELYTLIKERIDAGKTVKMSIGYQVIDSEIGLFQDKNVRFLNKIYVHEVSITLIPSNDKADVMGTKTRMEESQSIIDNIMDYKNRLEEIYNLGRGDQWIEQTKSECDRIYEAIGELKSWVDNLGRLDDQTKTLDVLDAEEKQIVNELELAKAKAQAILMR